MKTRIRHAAPKDIEAIADLWMAMMEEHCEFEKHLRLSDEARSKYANYARHYSTSDNSIVLVAEADADEKNTEKRVIGFALSYRVRNLPVFAPEYYGFVSDIVVAKGFRGCGIGAEMMEKIEAWFRTMGVSQVQLQAYSANDAALRFWRREGYEPYIEGMWKSL